VGSRLATRQTARIHEGARMRTYCVHCREGVLHLPAFCGRMQLAGCDEGACLPVEPAIERHFFAQAVARTLRHLHDACRLGASPLIGCALVQFTPHDDAVVTLRRVFIETIDRLSREPGTSDQGRLLQRRYLASNQPQTLLAEAMHMGASTLRRRVQRATALLVAELWSRELQSRRAWNGAA
jgi:hypothetical protein